MYLDVGGGHLALEQHNFIVTNNTIAVSQLGTGVFVCPNKVNFVRLLRRKS